MTDTMFDLSLTKPENGNNIKPHVSGKGFNLKSKSFNSLRCKGYIFITLLLSYMVFISWFVLNQQDVPLEQLEQFQKIQQAEAALVQADLAAFHVVTALFVNLTPSDLQGIVQYFSTLRLQYENLQRLFPEQAGSFKKLVESIPKTLENPSPDNLKQIHFHLAHSKTELDKLMSINRDRMAKLVEDYRIRNASIVMTTLTLGIMGLALLGAITSLFFNRLKTDLNTLQKRTYEIVQGYRGSPLPVKRKDEVGDLTEGINYMAKALDEREKELEIQRRQSSFTEKMTAIESLAGGIAHEIGNPITCIAGLAQEIQCNNCQNTDESNQKNIESMLQYIDGLVRVTRDLSVIDTNNSNEYQLLDINQLITNTLNIIRYDNRWSEIEIDMDFDYGIPAIKGSVNQLSQLITNVLENSLDAFNDNDHNDLIKIRTQLNTDNTLDLFISDNGSGMDKNTLDKIFDPFFSTKPVGKGTGLGLAICWSIVNSHSGKIKAESEENIGTIIEINLPLSSSGNPT